MVAVRQTDGAFHFRENLITPLRLLAHVMSFDGLPRTALLTRMNLLLRFGLFVLRADQGRRSKRQPKQ